MEIDEILNEIILDAFNYGKRNKHEYVTPEHILLCALNNEMFKDAITKCGGNAEVLINKVEEYVNTYISKIDEGIDVEESFGFKSIFYIATQ
ncbi:MAG: Clp protease N-terminal domain-containing protein, partial [Clostridium sp.]